MYRRKLCISLWSSYLSAVYSQFNIKINNFLPKNQMQKYAYLGFSYCTYVYHVKKWNKRGISLCWYVVKLSAVYSRCNINYRNIEYLHFVESCDPIRPRVGLELSNHKKAKIRALKRTSRYSSAHRTTVTRLHILPEEVQGDMYVQ